MKIAQYPCHILWFFATQVLSEANCTSLVRLRNKKNKLSKQSVFGKQNNTLQVKYGESAGFSRNLEEAILSILHLQ